MIVYVGTYTGPGRAEGIYVYRMDETTGALAHLQTLGGVDNPSFLALSQQQRCLYAVNETPEGEGQGPGVSAFAIDPQRRTLAPLNRQPAHGTSPCYVSLNPEGTHALIANYGNGTLAVYPVNGDGSLGEASHVVQHEGGSSHRRQAGPHAHSVRFDSLGRHVLACDLGVDRVFLYTLRDGRLVPHEPPFAQLSSGAGPRHSAFHPSGRFVYVNGEIDSSVNAFTYDADRGAFDLIGAYSTLPSDFTGNNSTAQVLVHPNGRTAYVSNRGHDSIAVFEVDDTRGALRPRGHVPSGGHTPRNFNIDPSGRFLYAANQRPGNIVVFRIGDDGGLTPTGHVTEVPVPVCVIFGRE
jgi:6-phosphogluconolactonase